MSGAPHGAGPHRVRVHPARLTGTVEVPGDKSVSHRCLLIGALVGTPVTVSGLAPSGDVLSMAAALRTLGARVELAPGPDGRLAGVVSGPLREASDVLDCGNSGTAMRLLAGVVAGIDGLAVLTGDASLRSRPVGRVAVPLLQMGATLVAAAEGTRPPLAVRGGSLHGITYAQPHASAQVKSCVLLAGLGADGPTTVVSPLVSRDHTERMLAHLGRGAVVVIDADGTERVTLIPGPLVAAPLHAPGDPSSAAFWHVAAAITGDAITTPGITTNPTRTGAMAVLALMGATVDRVDEREHGSEVVADVRVTGGDLIGGLVLAGRTVVDALDELPILALAGAMSRDGLEVTEAAELRVKESDRVATTVAALGAVGVEVEPRADGYRVVGGQRPRGGSVDAAGDHRIAMMAAIAAAV
ncbi:MAG: 3-phosphoshikimate 1-carboxyvinyltransferase, partial [Myxococcota bacterium]